MGTPLMPMEESEEGRAAAAAELAQLEADLTPKLQRRLELRRRLRLHDPPRDGPTYAQHLAELLTRLGRPATPVELLDTLLANSVCVGGTTRKDQLTSIAITLKRNRAFRRLSRGLYGLASWGDRAA